MKAIASGFGKEVTFGSAANGGTSRLKLVSADTSDGDPTNTTKNALFSHKTVKTDIANAVSQSNIFAVTDGEQAPTYGIELGGNDPAQIAKLG